MKTWICIAFAFVAGLWLALSGLMGVSSRVSAARAAEEASAVEPPSRLIPLEEGRVLACWTFPLRTFDGELQRCVACEERSGDAMAHPLNLACGR